MLIQFLRPCHYVLATMLAGTVVIDVDAPWFATGLMEDRSTPTVLIEASTVRP